MSDERESANVLVTQYGCRRCGTVTSGPAGGYRPVEAALIAVTGEPHKTHAPRGGIPIGALDIHHCEDGGIGIADLLGAEPE